MRRASAALVLVLVASSTFGLQGAASAAPARVKIAKVGVNAPIKKVGAKDGELLIGSNIRTIYTWRHGDPPCDPTGTTVYAGHASRKGAGVGDRWGELKRGDVIRISGCRFKVTKVRYWSAKRNIDHLYRVDGSPRVVLIACKPDDYSKRTMVFAKLIE